MIKITKKQWILFAITAVILIAVWLWLSAMVIGTASLFSSVHHCEICFDVPDSDLTVVAEHEAWLHSNISFYYVDENGERFSFPSRNFQDTYAFEEGVYEAINNQDGTFTIRWCTNPDRPKDTWESVTYAFPS